MLDFFVKIINIFYKAKFMGKHKKKKHTCGGEAVNAGASTNLPANSAIEMPMAAMVAITPVSDVSSDLKLPRVLEAEGFTPAKKDEEALLFQGAGCETIVAHGDDATASEGITRPIFGCPKEFVYSEGELSDVVLHGIPAQAVLTTEEISEVLKSKEEVANIISELESKKNIWRAMLKDPKSGVQIQVWTKRDSEKTARIATLADIKEMCLALRRNALEYIRFLAGKAAKLLYARHYEQAVAEFKIVLGYSIQVNGSGDLETLGIQLDYEIAKFSDPISGLRGEKLVGIEEVVAALERSLSDFPDNPGIKRSMAIADYILAQYYLSKGKDFIVVTSYLDRSERLRKEYGASAIELDKIRFLRGKIAYRNGSKSDGFEILMACYDFRKSQDQLNSDLIPVLEMLSEIMQEQYNVGWEITFLAQLLDIQKHHQADEREIVATQLRMLRAMKYNVSGEEFWTVMREVEVRLSTILVTQENVKVGLNYSDLAQTRMSIFLPQEWSKVKKREYHSETLKLICKAEAHLNAVVGAADDAGVTVERKNLNVLKERCVTLIDCFRDPTTGVLRGGEPLHPEDAVEVALLAVQNDAASESSTKRELKALSEFSSEVRHSLVDVAEGLLTIADFELLPEEGTISPFRLRTAQAGINPEFRDGNSLEEMKRHLIKNPEYTAEIPPIEIGIHDGRVYSFDTRRLIIHMQAKEKNSGVYIRYKKITGEYLQQRVKAVFSSRPWNGIVTALRYGGKGSEARPYIDPPFREQLQATVDKEFKFFPSGRDAADANGFPVAKKRAKKLYAFFSEKAGNGSSSAKIILDKAEEISKSQGKSAAYDFLIGQKCI